MSNARRGHSRRPHGRDGRVPQPFQVSGRGWSDNGLRKDAGADALYLTPIRNGPAIQTKQ